MTSDCAVEGEEDQQTIRWIVCPTNGSAHSVPWRLIGERVTVTVTGSELRVLHAGREVARHALRAGRKGRVTDPAHFAGIGRRTRRSRRRSGGR